MTPTTPPARVRSDELLAGRTYAFRASQSSDNMIRGHASVWGSLNSFGEVFVPGAYSATIEDRDGLKPLVMGYQHRDAIGKWAERAEDDHGLYLAGPVSDTALGRDALVLARDGVLTGLSVGFWPRAWQYAEPGERVSFETPFGTRSYQFDEWVLYILEAELAEASLVIAPSDDEARTIRTRSARIQAAAEAERAAQAPPATPDAPEDGASSELLARIAEQLDNATRTLKEG